jgi:hypothetical protein
MVDLQALCSLVVLFAIPSEFLDFELEQATTAFNKSLKVIQGIFGMIQGTCGVIQGTSANLPWKHKVGVAFYICTYVHL